MKDKKGLLGYKYREDSIKKPTIDEVSDTIEDELQEDTLIEDNDTLIEDYTVDDDIQAIQNVDELALIIKAILELSWGKDWGELVPEYIEDQENPIFPKIVYDINTRELSEFNSKKPMLFQNIDEVVDGKPTGDGFSIYRQWYDTVVEFNFYARTIKEARELMHRFEQIIYIYMGVIKQKGLSEMIYLEEIPSEKSLKYKPGTPMKANAYYVRFENIYKVRHSLLKEISYIVRSYTHDDINKK